MKAWIEQLVKATVRARPCIVGLLGLSSPATAHLLPAQTATMNIAGNTAYFVVSVPASALSGVDDDGNGSLSIAEIARHNRAIALQFNRRFSASADGLGGTPMMTMAWSPQTDGPQTDSSYVVILHSVRFGAAPVKPAVRTDLFGTRDGEAQMTMTAKHDKREDTAEVAILSPNAPAHTFFRNGFAVFGDFVRIGIGHILSGIDHLLFLLTIIAAVTGWRRWLGVVTSFTVAHSITLSLAVMGLVRVPPTLVEPAIAASIVLMAANNIWRGRDSRIARPWVGVAIVFACGLLHGLGFAYAIEAMAPDGAHRLATLAGFNIGIELGQFLFIGALLLVAALVGSLFDSARPGLPRLASIIAGLLGAGLLIERVLPMLRAAG